MTTKIAKWRLRFWQAIEPIYQFAVERLFGYVTARVEWIERVGKAIVENGQTRNLIPKKIV